MKEFGNLIKFIFVDVIWGGIKSHLVISTIISVVLVVAIVVTSVFMLGDIKKPVDASSETLENSSTLSTEEESSSEEVSSDESSSEESSSEASSSTSVVSKPSYNGTVMPEPNIFPPKNSNITPAPKVNITAPNGVLYNKCGTKFNYQTPMDMEDNIFMDSLIYTGYDVAKQRQDNLMWQYILSAQKKRIGTSGPYNWLSKISYDYDGRTSGYETNAEGKPDIDFFIKNDLVCASFIGYVYANYLPNFVGIDTSVLGKPEDFGWSNVLADSWYNVGKTWVQKGYSEFIEFDCRKASSGALRITPERSIPIGSLIVTANDSNAKSDYAGHVSIYAGWKDGYNWVYHVGNDNGPEFCSIERMGFNPDPHYKQWLTAIITPPNILNYAPSLKVTVKDENGKAVSGVNVSVVRDKNGKNISIGTTNEYGVASKDYLYYDGYTLSCTAEGYESVSGQKINLTANNNSLNSVEITLKKK